MKKEKIIKILKTFLSIMVCITAYSVAKFGTKYILEDNIEKIDFSNIITITQKALNDEYASKEMHDQIWQILYQIKDKKTRYKLVTALKSSFFNMEIFGSEFWESARLSLKNGQVVKTQKLAKYMSDTSSLLSRDTFDFYTDREYEAYVNSFKNSANIDMAIYDDLLSKIAKKQEIENGLVLDVQSIEYMQNQMPKNVKIINTLFDENWKQ